LVGVTVTVTVTVTNFVVELKERKKDKTRIKKLYYRYITFKFYFLFILLMNEFREEWIGGGVGGWGLLLLLLPLLNYCTCTKLRICKLKSRHGYPYRIDVNDPRVGHQCNANDRG
jgi:hypothetical protein